MKNLDFLNKLKTEGKLELVEPSEQMSVSYGKKSQECREVAKLAFDNDYFESATTQAYYSMYNAVQSLFFRCGLKIPLEFLILTLPIFIFSPSLTNFIFP